MSFCENLRCDNVVRILCLARCGARLCMWCVVWCGVWRVRAKPQTHPCLGPQPRSRKRRSNDKTTADTRNTPDKHLHFGIQMLFVPTSPPVSLFHFQRNAPIHVGTSLNCALCFQELQAFVVIGDRRNMWNDSTTQRVDNPPPVYPQMYEWAYNPAEYAHAWWCTDCGAWVSAAHLVSLKHLRNEWHHAARAGRDPGVWPEETSSTPCAAWNAAAGNTACAVPGAWAADCWHGVTSSANSGSAVLDAAPRAAAARTGAGPLPGPVPPVPPPHRHPHDTFLAPPGKAPPALPGWGQPGTEPGGISCGTPHAQEPPAIPQSVRDGFPCQGCLAATMRIDELEAVLESMDARMNSLEAPRGG